ncbi:generic methyltransferase isoform B [Chlorella sorokiniana]|uniref:Generic methyltransferase isoform B n=1 Tax=Chlorella sorokiniana TaxID=3076 RepID=A0A2P6TV81_CHLSO|nr:generic methyltransferase isoform B [Chlorella sorokiniana]|eukprot:PRW57977.1 generic methyltransferase isoform B [Chlorella sorokiniana]
MSPVTSLQNGNSFQELKRKRAEEEAGAAPVAKQPVHQPSNHNTFDNDKAESWRENLRGDAELVSGPAGERPGWWWSGPKPVQGTAGVQPDGTITSLPLPNLASCTRQQVLDYFDNTWCLTEVLFSALQGEECFYRPPYHNLRHPFIFYFGHVAVFYVNKLRVAGIQPDPVNLHFEQVFEVGVDEMSWDDLSKNEMVWPSVREVIDYRRQVYQMVRRHIETHPDLDRLPVTWSSQAWAFFMCFEHERIHLETSSVLMRELPAHLLRRPLQWPAYHASVTDAARTPPANELVAVEAGDVTLGKPADWPSYGWDNEYGSRTFHVHPFKASKTLISNAEFLDFVRDGGYRSKQWWSEEGWRWRTFRNAKWPTFWVPEGPQGLHRYKLRLVFEVVDLPLALPAVVNHHEARAYANWLSAKQGLRGDAALRLLSEPEHHRLRQVAKKDAEGRAAEDPVMSLSGAGFAKGAVANLNLAFGAECAVDAMAPTPAGFHDVFGNLWQWCEDHLASLPGSQGVHPYYDDFSTPCYDGEHHVIMGGSFVSTGDEGSVFARFHFRPHFFQHAGFRLVSGTGPLQTSCQDSPPPHVGTWDPSTKKGSQAAADAAAAEALQQRLLSAYGSADQLLEGGAAACGLPGAGFPARLAGLVLDAAKKLGVPLGTALEVGAGVGATAFHLAAGGFESVIGVEHEARAVAAATAAQQAGTVAVGRKDEGHLRTPLELPVPGGTAARNRVAFRQMDPCCIAADMVDFDAVLLSGVLEKIPSPKAPLGRMGGPRGLVKKGGLLLVSSTFCWSERTAASQLWLGGTTNAEGNPVRSRDGLAAALGPEFELVSEAELPCATRSCERMYSVSIQHCSLWRRVA